MAFKEYDVFVIGTGTAGKTVAYDCAAEGMKVAIADNREFGGTCANRGCDPKKVLVGITEALHLSENLKGKGIASVPEINWQELQKFKSTFTDAIPYSTERDLKEAGIEMYHQSPKFLDENTLSVEGKTVKAKKIVIATGQKPMALKIPGREHLKESDDFLDLEELPESIVFVGAGYIGMEFAHIAARCGAKVTVVEFGEYPLAPFDADIVSHLVQSSEEIGIKFIFNAKVSEVEKLQKNFRVSFEKNGKTESIDARMVFNTAGRVPSIGELDLEKGNVAYQKEGISVNEFLQNTKNPSVYACGDVSASGSLPLTPVSSQEARIVSENIRKGNHTKMDFPPVPSVVFTIPQVASIGLTEEEAKKKGYDFVVEYKSVPKWFNAKRVNEKTYAYKTLVDKKRNLILGAHIIAPEAGEMINLFVLAMCGKLTCENIKEMIFAYPTWGNDIKGMV
ncbi:dihydrolipoyl dehydrogenase family protein [Aequorivita echinoideorum]|uniref:Dihydrolipoyl dehydrogenase n=1 Tax=Aequorivita echinoideorum TaxID=1549647 RepID=A0ABS5S5U5_9FLAO|nr:NAD(P)/FAD-dependent oxidoreductase [Aequorivita echinoideorum]MBT0607210.1 NAD(P)/FAD-dependent oxidoreductase [Aequorivita echinoideorum]